MLDRSILTALLALAVLAALPTVAGAAPATSRAVVFSQVIADRSVGADGEVVEEAAGGLFAVRSGRLNQLTENPTDSEPAFSADGRTIAFARSGDIWVMRADGSGQLPLTAGDEVDGRPLIAPNGRYVLFERREAEGGRRDLHTVRIGGSEPRRLIHHVADEMEATFASGGRLIAFVIRGKTGAGITDDIYTVRPWGARLRRVTLTATVDEFAPRFFARGLVYSRGRSGDGAGAYADVYTSRADGRRPRPLIRGAGSAYVEDVDRNGGLLLFRRAQGLWVKPLPVGRRAPRRARKLTELADQSRTNAVFSWDGRKVAAFVATENRETLSAIDVRRRRAVQLAQGYFLASGDAAATVGPVMAWQPTRRRR